MQRARIMQAMVEVVAGRGFAGASVGLVIARARISRRTFHAHFDSLEDCSVAVLDLGLERASALIAEAFAREARWQDGLRAALASLLVFFDSQPLLARTWLVEPLAAGSWALERRERNVALLTSMIVEHWSIPGGDRPEPLTAAGGMASVLGLIHTHLVTKEGKPLIGLLGPLMGLVTAPYLDKRGVAREIARGAQLAHTITAGDPRWAPSRRAGRHVGLDAAPDVELPALLRNPRARRARECLSLLAACPGVSNRELATALGVPHQPQISRLLSRLRDEGLVSKGSEGAGRRNVWCLTPRGEATARWLSDIT